VDLRVWPYGKLSLSQMNRKPQVLTLHMALDVFLQVYDLLSFLPLREK